MTWWHIGKGINIQLPIISSGGWAWLEKWRGDLGNVSSKGKGEGDCTKLRGQ